MVRESVVLSADLRAPARARAWARSQVVRSAPARADDALLVVSELVTNAVRHAGTEIVVSIGTDTDRIRIEVSDGVDDPPRLRAGVPGGSRPDGRGLVIVSAVADGWGVENTPGRPGKTVWADVVL